MTYPERDRKAPTSAGTAADDDPAKPAEPQSAQRPPGALVSRAQEPAPDGPRRAGLEVELGSQVGGLPRTERRAAVGRRHPAPPASQKTDIQTPAPRGRLTDPPRPLEN